jgi:CheY-like chemotaxis protein
MESAMQALRKKVLVVDDDPVIGRSFDRVLSESGYEVSTARDGPQALASMSREDYDVVFTDIKMPGMDGLELAERIRKTRPWVPVVIITGYGTPANVERAEAAGVAGFLDKPLSPGTIERSTRAALRVIEGGARKAQPAPVAALFAPAVAVAVAVPAAVVEGRPESRAIGVLKSAGLYLAAPFCALAYMVATAGVMLGTLGWMAARPLAKRLGAIVPFLKNVGLFLAAPFVGLAYAIAFPFVGAGVLLWHAAKALKSRPGAE